MSQQVSWWSVHQAVSPLLTSVESWPLLGTPEWCALPDGDLRKVAALFDAAQHWSLRMETCQQGLAQAAHDVSAGEDWSAIAAEMRARDEVYIRREPV